MTLILNGTTGLSDVDGTAAAPAIRGTDADTGLYFPTANEVAAAAGGVAVWNAASTFGFKNRIINGAMVIDQRNAGASVTFDNGVYPVDRFRSNASQTGKATAQQNAGSVTPPRGFSNYLGITSSSAYSVSSSDYFTIQHNIEGLNVSDLGWGAAGAQTVTLSFWVRSSNRSYPFSFTISAANTWEQKSVTIAGDTSGTWLTTNGVGIRLFFGLGVGSTVSTTAGAWAAGNYYAPTGATSVVGTNGATFYVTGVQFERGSAATSFDFRDYGRELMLCQRYYQEIGTAAGNEIIYLFYTAAATTYYLPMPLPVPMRATPTATVAGTWGVGSVNTLTVSSGTNSFRFNIATSSGGNNAFFQNNGAGAKLTFAIEL
jgi:hypothetical protein